MILDSRRFSRHAAKMLGSLGCLLQLACAQARPPPDIVLVVIDTLRIDRLGSYGSQRDLTPFLDELASGSHLFRRAYAQASWTLPSVASLFTSRYPSQHGVDAFDAVLIPGEQTLAELLRERGYATAGFSANLLLSRKAGFGQGFDAFRVHGEDGDSAAGRPEKRASEITLEALVWLDAQRAAGGHDRPVFLYLHYMEPHVPYAPAPELLERVRGTRPPLDLERVNRDVFGAVLAAPPPERMHEITDAYDAEVMTIDAELRVLADALAQRGMFEDALIVITADHGQEFHDHGGFGHGSTLFDEVLRVPLIVRMPGQRQGAVVDRVVSSIDVAPTLLELIGGDPPDEFEGESFARDLSPGPWSVRLARTLEDPQRDPAESAALGEGYLPRPDGAEGPLHESALVTGRYKLIRAADGSHHVYALDADPRELRPDAVPEHERERLKRLLDERERHLRGDGAPRRTREIDAETRARLRALGYSGD